MNIVWAYGMADVDSDGNFNPHSMQSRGGMKYTFIASEDTDGGNGGGNGSSSMVTPSILGIIALFLFQRVIGA